MRGRLQKYHSNYFYVDVDGVVYECFLKGLLKKALKSADEGGDILVGDWVTIDSVDAANQTARIVSIESRQNALSRPKIANVDQALVLYPLKQPEFDPASLDRYLTHISLAGISACICVSKSDLADNTAQLAEIRALYQEKLGYPLAFVSVFQAETLGAVREFIENKVTVLAGPSGAGKSSLMNAIHPDLKLRVGEVSEKIERGQHTTRHIELLPVFSNTFVADTPGFSYLKFDTVLPEALMAAYPEFSKNDVQCEFSDCLHLQPKARETEDSEDPDDTPLRTGCAFLNAETFSPKPELIAPSRYASYSVMMAEAAEYKEAARQSSQKQEYGFKQVSNKGKKDIAILRLKGKNREASRRTQRQLIDSLDHTDEDGDDSE